MGVTTCTDEEFGNYRRHWAKNIQDIKLPSDMNTGIGQQVLAQLDEAYAYLRIDLGELEAARSRSESIIRQHERGKAIGRNEDDRKKNATEYLENFPIGETQEDTVDMYEWHRILDGRYAVVKALVDVVFNKQQRLITMSGFIKVDSQLGNNY